MADPDPARLSPAPEKPREDADRMDAVLKRMLSTPRQGQAEAPEGEITPRRQAFIVEARGEKEDKELELQFLRDL